MTAAADTHGGTCRNCGTALTGDHCHGCGQAARVHRSMAAIGHDLMHGVLHLDGKLANTLPLLALKPGELTRRYAHGERRRFVSPMGMFLFSVTILFLAMQVLGLHLFEIGEEDLVGPGLARIEASLQKVAAADPAAGRVSGGFGVTVDTEDGRKVLVGSKIGEPEPDPQAIDGDAKAGSIATKRGAERDRARAALPLVRQARAAWGQRVFDSKEDGTGNATLDAAVKKIAQDPALVAYKVQANSYKFSWALIPLSVPFVWLLFFWRRDVGLYDHTVFVTYSLAAMTLLTVAMMLLSRVGVPLEAVMVAFCVLAPLHIFVHLRGSYGLSKRATLLRFGLLSVFIWFAVALFAAILFALGAIG